MGGGGVVHVYKNEQGGGLSGGDYVRIPSAATELWSAAYYNRTKRLMDWLL